LGVSPRKRVLANVTDLGLLLKAGRASGLLWVTRLSTGDPVGGARVTLYRPDGKRVHRGLTDPRGIALLPGTAELARDDDASGADPYYAARRQRLIAIVEHGGDMAVVDGNWANGIQLWNFGVPVDRSGAVSRLRTFIQSDRGIYRPGETAHFKGLVREVSAGQTPRQPRARRVRVAVRDSKNNPIWQRRLALSDFGSFALDLPLGESAPTGDYTLEATVGGQTFRETFMVEAFRPVSFELRTAPVERHQRLGDKIAVAFDARYLFGAPLSKASARWRVQRRPHWLRFPRFAQYAFADTAALGERYFWHGASHYRELTNVADGQTVSDTRGRFVVEVADGGSKLTGPHDYLIHASVTDPTDQTVSKQLVVTAHQSEHYLGLHSQEWVQAVDMPFSVNTVALAPDGKQVSTAAQLSLVRRRHLCKHDGRYRSYSRCTLEHELIWKRPVTIPATGTGTERILPKKPGEYIIRLEGVDSRGVEVAASTFVWVLGKGEAFWSGDESARMSLIASKASYRPGELARLVPRANLPNPTALVTLERDGVLEAQVLKLKSTSNGLVVPVTAGYAPNVFASVALVSGRQGRGDRGRPRFKMGVVELRVRSDAQRLEVKVESDRAVYEPGDKVEGTIRVTSGGKPVRAEVALAAADEGVLQLIAYRTPDPMKTMYQPWSLGVDSSTTWNRVARLNAPDGADPEEGGDSGGPAGERIRSRFVSSAYWAPSLRTNARGVVRFSFEAPDNLTAFRLMAVAADRGSRFGSGESRFTLRKPLLAQPITPRFLRVGDRVQLGVLVRNDTGRDGLVHVAAQASGLKLSGGAREVQLRSGESRRVLFEATVLSEARARLRFSVALGGHRDRVALALPIVRARIVAHELLARGALRDGASARATLEWDDHVLPDESYLGVAVDRTGLSELEGALRYLIGYPYGCLEQTLSRFIPLVKVRDLAGSLQLKQLPRHKMKRFVAAGVAKVIRHQHSDGAFGLWPGAAPRPHLTVYALWGLDEARRAGVKVPQYVFDRGLRAVQRWLVSAELARDSGRSATVAMGAYLLARLGKPDTGVQARLFDLHRALPSYGLAFLLRAMVLTKAPAEQLTVVKRALLQRVRVEGARATVREDAAELEQFMSSDVRSAAMVLSALVELEPTHPMVPKLVAGLRSAQGQSGRWGNTQENLYALVALADYARGETRGRSRVELWWTPATGQAGTKRRLMRRTIRGAAVVSLKLPLSKLQPGLVSLHATGDIRYQLRLTTLQADRNSRAVRRGLAVERTYLDPQTNTPLSAFRPGQLVKVRLKLQALGSKPRRYIALSDPLPAGLEAVNTKLATSQVAATPGGSRVGNSPQAGFRTRWNHVELRDDRVLAFADRLDPGNGLDGFEYLARATLRGQFYAAPARVEQMYQPEHYGRSRQQLVIVSDQPAAGP
jgi:uncharacterized protein YfaS (alpha-2-macroglobulin family)